MERMVIAMTLAIRISQDMTAAMKAQDADRLSALRLIRAALQKQEIEKRAPLDDGEVIKVLGALAKQRREAADQFETHNRPDLAQKELAELALIKSYLPAAASAEEVRQAVEAAVAETGAASLKEMGAVMKAVMAALAGKSVDGKAVSDLVKERLSR